MVRAETFSGSIPERGTAIVVGASLAGLALSISLARSGLAVNVFERAAEERNGGTGLRLWAGMGETIRRRDGSGFSAPTIASIASSGVPGPEGWATVRRRLADAAATEPGISIHYESEVVEIGQDAETAWIKDASGKVHGADILLGADGHRSMVRRSVDPSHPDATYAGYTIWTGKAPYEAAPGWAEGHNHMDMITLPHGDGAMIVGETKTNGEPRRYFWQWYDPTSDDYLHESGALVENVSQHSLVNEGIAASKYEDIHRRAGHWPAPWDQIVRHSVHRRQVIATPIAEYVPRRLTRGRIAIIGDAAHVPSPMTGAGFDTGLGDAETLGELTDHGVVGRRGVEVLKTYEKQRLRTAQRMVRSGQGFGRSLLNHPNH
ncbi:FAD-dependent monooxygenase [Arthrobacter rhombi]|uniref:FAD-dependent monooxygenase n=1 Tax=Arthrobacter rhombi TaxID=71253 RepID=UPI003FD07810